MHVESAGFYLHHLIVFFHPTAFNRGDAAANFSLFLLTPAEAFRPCSAEILPRRRRLDLSRRQLLLACLFPVLKALWCSLPIAVVFFRFSSEFGARKVLIYFSSSVWRGLDGRRITGIFHIVFVACRHPRGRRLCLLVLPLGLLLL